MILLGNTVIPTLTSALKTAQNSETGRTLKVDLNVSAKKALLTSRENVCFASLPSKTDNALHARTKELKLFAQSAFLASLQTQMVFVLLV